MLSYYHKPISPVESCLRAPMAIGEPPGDGDGEPLLASVAYNTYTII